MRLETVTDHISLVRGEGNGGLAHPHSILIVDQETVLIDTGCGIDTLEQLREEYRVSYIINSHTHPDHSAGNWVFRDRPIHVPEEGFDTAGNLDAIAGRFVSKEIARFFREFAKETFGFRNCRPTHSYNSQTLFDFGSTTLKPVHTPGHTKDHYCFYELRESVLLSFDYDLTTFPWYGHRESSIPEFRESLKRLKALSPKIVASAHRGIVTEDIDAEFDRYCGIIDERDEQILSLLESGKTIDQLVECAPIYGGFPYAEPLLRYWEGQMIERHLEQLEIAGRVERRGAVYVKR
jgi:glyoxylase-like metal-dependent hydrolase (beta-lactamase superfamily II)